MTHSAREGNRWKKWFRASCEFGYHSSLVLPYLTLNHPACSPHRKLDDKTGIFNWVNLIRKSPMKKDYTLQVYMSPESYLPNA